VPRRTDIRTIAILGSGPIVIGQACEFDYSGVQALKVLRDEGYRTVLINSNPATIMTDPGWADRTYLEPLDLQGATEVLRRERPDALLPTLGGQTALNLAMKLQESGVLDQLGIELIGASARAIETAEDRRLFADAMASVGLRVPRSAIAHSVAEGREALAAGLSLPVVIRPAFTLGGHGGGFAETAEEFDAVVARGVSESPISQVLVEESVRGWGEFELEVVRDRNDNVVIICSIENIDPMGVHTGDSVCVAPAMTLSDREYQALRDAAAASIRAVGVETGGSNVQFALNRHTGEIVVIEMNPRVSRSSALASKATGYPIAKVATKLAVGYTLDEIPNDITRTTPASFEPTIDYVVVKAPRFAFEKFPGADDRLTTQMKSVGEAMGIGRTFCEAYGKAMRSRELDRAPRESGGVAVPVWDRLDALLGRLRAGERPAALSEESSIHPWFCDELERIVLLERDAAARGLDGLDADALRRLKRHGVSDARIARTTGRGEREVRERRRALGVVPVFKTVDSCGGEVAAETSYLYSTYDRVDEPLEGDRPRVLILGSGPNRIGQGIEFDYCCVQAVQAFQRLGYETVMVNCNPETVSTDYDTSDRLYFEPLTVEDVIAVVERERPVGVVAQFGGQTPLKLARGLVEAGVPIIGTSPAAIDLAEDRLRFGELLRELGLKAPEWAIAHDVDEAVAAAERIGYPVLVRPSYVLGGREMRICYGESEVRSAPVKPNTLVDRFVEDAVEIDVDAVGDGEDVLVGAVMQHVEEAGIHSGDSSCVIPPLSLGPELEQEIRRQTVLLARGLGVRGLVNVQFALRGNDVYVLEANPRASRTVPFVEKATGAGLIELACRVAAGERLADIAPPEPRPLAVAVKEVVLPFVRFPGSDPILGPEMRSTGEVMALAPDFATAFAKAARAAGNPLPSRPRMGETRSAFLSVCDRDKSAATLLAHSLHELGFRLHATPGTARAIEQLGLPVSLVAKVSAQEGSGSDDETVVDLIRERRVDLIVNTPEGRGARADGYLIRTAAISAKVPCLTTIAGAAAAVQAIGRAWVVEPKCLQELHA
jgi:carbamoyl-phosphate synthase large subunit